MSNTPSSPPPSELSLAAQGVYAILRSLDPADHACSVAALSTYTRSGGTALNSALRELKEAGLLHTWRTRRDDTARPGFIYHWRLERDAS